MQYHLKRLVGFTAFTSKKTNHSPDSSRGMSYSHPLTALFSDPYDLTFLSPGHFLTGAPESNLSDLSGSCLYRWKHLQQIQQLFWKRQSTDYLNSLQQRGKWASTELNLHPGGMVFLVKVSSCPPQDWRLAVGEEVHPGRDDLVQVATFKTTGGSTRCTSL